jgi:hypothetical protein
MRRSIPLGLGLALWALLGSMAVLRPADAQSSEVRSTFPLTKRAMSQCRLQSCTGTVIVAAWGDRFRGLCPGALPGRGTSRRTYGYPERS